MKTYEAVIRETSEKNVSAYAPSKTYPAYILLVLALAASFFVHDIVKDRIGADNVTAFEKATASVVSRMNSAVREHEQIIKSMQNLYENFPFVVRDVFELYGSIAPRTYSSIQSLAFAPYVKEEELGQFTFYARSERYYTYKIHPEGEREEYYPTYYLVPLEQNPDLLGFDLASDSTIMKALTRARESGAIVASSFYPLRESDSLGFMMGSYVYKVDSRESSAGIRNISIEGFIFEEIRAQEFFTNALGEGVASDTSIVFQCFDRSSGKDLLVFESTNMAKYPRDYQPLFVNEVDIAVGDSEFVVKFATVPAFGGEFQNNLPLLSFIGAILTSFLLFAFTLSTVSGRARALDLADRMTRSQRRIVESSNDMIGVMTLDGEWKGINPASVAVLGCTPEELISTNFFDHVLEEDKSTASKALSEAEDEQRIHYEVRMVASDGSTKWISWNSTVSRSDGNVYCIGRDITEMKNSEAQIRLKNKQVELARQFTLESENFKTRFLEDVSFYFRTALTGILGYMQLIMSKMYSSEEQRTEFFSIAHRSAEDLLARVDQLLEVAELEKRSKHSKLDGQLLPIEPLFESIIADFQVWKDKNFAVSVNKEQIEEYQLKANSELFRKALDDIIGACTEGLAEAEIKMNLQVNPFENVLEIQFLVSSNTLAAERIEMFKSSSDDDLLDLLKDDVNDIIFRIAFSTSIVRMMNGSMIVDSLGDEGNVVMISLPCKKVPHLQRTAAA